MLKKMFAAALLCGAMAAPVLAQKLPLSFGLSLASAGTPHPFENPPEPGSGSGINGGYGNFAEKNYSTSRFTVEGFVQYALKQSMQLRLRGGYSFRQTTFSAVFINPDQSPVNRSTQQETGRSWHLVPGLIRTHDLGKFSLNAGVEIPVHLIGRLESYSTWESLNTPDADISESWRYFPGGFSVGIGPVAGLAFQPGRRWSIGVEARSAWTYTRITGNYQEKSSWTGTDNTQTGTAETYRNSGMSNVQMALQLRFVL